MLGSTGWIRQDVSGKVEVDVRVSGVADKPVFA